MKYHIPINLTKELINILNIEDKDAVSTEIKGLTQGIDNKIYVFAKITKMDTDHNWDISLLVYIFDSDFNLLNIVNHSELGYEINSVYVNQDASINSFPNGEILYSTTLNRSYIFDQTAKTLVKKFNLRPQSGLSEKTNQYNDIIIDDEQLLLDNNLAMHIEFCPDSGKMLALIDTETNAFVNQKSKRGDIIAYTENKISSINDIDTLNIFAFLDKICIYRNLPKQLKIEANKENLDDKIREFCNFKLMSDKKFDIYNNVFTYKPKALGNSEFLVPIYCEMVRSESKGRAFIFYIINIETNKIREMDLLDLDDDSPFKQHQFNIVVLKNSKKIVHKNMNGIYMFSYDGKLIETIRFKNSQAKSLKPFQLIDSINETLVFYHEKNSDLLTINFNNKEHSLENQIIESISLYKKSRTNCKKLLDFKQGIWFNKI